MCPSLQGQATRKDDPGQPAGKFGAHRGADIKHQSHYTSFSVPVLKAQISKEGFPKVTKMRPARSRSEEMTMQQLAGMMQGLQEAMAASKAEQERMQADLAASQARNDKPSSPLSDGEARKELRPLSF